MGTFTPEDVAVGDTVHLIERVGDVAETHIRGEVYRTTRSWLGVKGAARGKWTGDWVDVEIVSVEKPKRELVTGGIYEVTEDAETVVRRRGEGGWCAAYQFAADAASPLWTDRDAHSWIIGRRLILVDHPSERPGVAYDDLVTEAVTREQAK